MSTQYYYVVNPPQDDINKSVRGDDSPYIKEGTDEVWYLKFNNGHKPPTGLLEYHAEKQALFDEPRVTSTKTADHLLLDKLVQIGSGLAHEFWDDNKLLPVPTAHLHIKVDPAMGMLRDGHISAARAYLVALATDVYWTASIKTAFIAEIDIVLNDYPHLKDTEVY